MQHRWHYCCAYIDSAFCMNALLDNLTLDSDVGWVLLLLLCRNRDITMHPKQQQQQQILATSGGSVEPGYASQPVQTTSVIGSYRHRQSSIIGMLLVVTGTLSIIFSIAGIAVSSKQRTFSTDWTGTIIGWGIMVSSN